MLHSNLVIERNKRTLAADVGKWLGIAPYGEMLRGDEYHKADCVKRYGKKRWRKAVREAQKAQQEHPHERH